MSKVLGLDLGEKSLGIAISDSMRMFAHGVENLRFEEMDFDKAVERISFYQKTERITEVALGLPLNMKGTESEHSAMCRDFGERLEKELGLTVHLVDERWTTKLANRRLLEADLSRNKRKQVIDKMAAVVILETFIGGC